MASHTKQAKTKLSSRSTFGLVGGDVIDSYEEDDSLYFNHSSTDFSHLPAEIMENIFCQLPIVDLMLNCTLVCHQWYNVISQDSVSKCAVNISFCLFLNREQLVNMEAIFAVINTEKNSGLYGI